MADLMQIMQYLNVGVPVYDSTSISTLFILVQLFRGKNAPVLNTLPPLHDLFQGLKGHWSVIIVIHPYIILKGKEMFEPGNVITCFITP